MWFVIVVFLAKTKITEWEDTKTSNEQNIKKEQRIERFDEHQWSLRSASRDSGKHRNTDESYLYIYIYFNAHFRQEKSINSSAWASKFMIKERGLKNSEKCHRNVEKLAKKRNKIKWDSNRLHLQNFNPISTKTPSDYNRAMKIYYQVCTCARLMSYFLW